MTGSELKIVCGRVFRTNIGIPGKSGSGGDTSSSDKPSDDSGSDAKEL